MNNSLKSICDDYGLTPEGVRHALSQYQKIIVELTNGRLSKLTYDAQLILDYVQEGIEKDIQETLENRERSRF